MPTRRLIVALCASGSVMLVAVMMAPSEAATGGGLMAATGPSPCTVIGGLGPGTRWLSGVGTVPISREGAGARAATAEANALTTADERARADLQARACVGWSDSDCALVMRGAVQGMGAPWFDSTRGVACSIWGLPGGPTDNSPSQRTAEAAIDALSQAIGGALGQGEPVLLESATTADGCAVPELAALNFRIRNGLPGVRFADASMPSTDARRVRLDVSEAGPNLQVAASVIAADGYARPAGLALFPEAAYGLSALPVGVCSSDRSLGLMGGRRIGAAGLQVDLRVRADGDRTPDSLCYGQGFSLEVATSEPARVHIYSVAPDGRALHVWPEPPGSGRLTGTQSVGTFVAAPYPVGDERILAVAVPDSAPLNALDAHHGFCRTERFSGATIPTGAAVASVTWRLDTREDVCAASSWDRQALAEALASLPDCGR